LVGARGLPGPSTDIARILVIVFLMLAILGLLLPAGHPGRAGRRCRRTWNGFYRLIQRRGLHPAMSENDAAESSTDAADVETGEAAVEPDEDLVERVAESDPETIAREIASLRSARHDAEDAAAEYEAEAEELEEQLKHKQADFQNFKKRMDRKLEEEKARATEELVERLLDVRNNLVRALEQDEDADIRGGVRTTLDQFDRVLDAENVVAIEPEPGEEVDPQRHEVLMRVSSDRAEGTVDELHRPGYEMAGKVLQAAQVTVSDGSDAD
jgi:molecular chaperone GrpE